MKTSQTFGATSGPQTGDIRAIIGRFWKLILVVAFVVFVVVGWTGTRPPTGFRSDARIEVESVDQEGERSTVRGAAVIELFRSDAVHEQALQTTGLNATEVEWRASQEEDVETIRLEVVTDDPVLSLTYIQTWLDAATAAVKREADTATVLTQIDERLATLVTEKEGLDAELLALEDRYRQSGNIEDRVTSDVRGLELRGELGSLQTEIDRHTNQSVRLERTDPVGQRELVLLRSPKQAPWGLSISQMGRNAVFGGALGLIIGVGSALLAAVLRPRLYDRADLDRFGIDVIGPIPANRLPAPAGDAGLCSDHAVKADIVVGTYGADREALSSRVAAQVMEGAMSKDSHSGISILPIGELTGATGMASAGTARGTVVAVPTGVASPGNLRRLLTAIHLSGGSLLSVVLIEPEQPPFLDRLLNRPEVGTNAG